MRVFSSKRTRKFLTNIEYDASGAYSGLADSEAESKQCSLRAHSDRARLRPQVMNLRHLSVRGASKIIRVARRAAAPTFKVRLLDSGWLASPGKLYISMDLSE